MKKTTRSAKNASNNGSKTKRPLKSAKWHMPVPLEPRSYEKKTGLFMPFSRMLFFSRKTSTELTEKERRLVPKVPNKLTLSLGSKYKQGTFERAWGLAPLRAVLQRAVEVLNPDPSPDSSLDAEWLAHMAIRAVAEAVIRQSGIPVPTKVDLVFAGPEEGYINDHSPGSKKRGR